MPAERDGHHGADCRWIGALGQHDFCPVDLCLRCHHGSVLRGRRARLSKPFRVSVTNLGDVVFAGTTSESMSTVVSTRASSATFVRLHRAAARLR